MAQQGRNSLFDTSHEDGMINDQLAKEQVQHVILVDAHKLMRLALQRVVTGFPRMHMSASLSTIHDLLPATDTSCAQAMCADNVHEREAKAAYTLVLGPSVPVSDCLTVLKQLRERQALGGVVVMQQDLQPETVRTLIEQGVHGLLDESASEQDLAQAIRSASMGTIFLSRRVRSMLAVSMSRAAGHLTERELQVLSHLKHGESNFRIAHGLGLKEKTIEKYLTTIYDKLNVHSRTEAILYLQKLHF